MKNFLDNIKEKLFPKPEFDLEDDDDFDTENDSSDDNEEEGEEIEDVEINNEGPEIASAKKNKMIVIVASSILITAVLYFLFFKDANKPKEQLQSVAPLIRPTKVARSETGSSPFELENLEKKSENSEFANLEKPKAPTAPELPEIPEGASGEGLILPSDLFVEEPKKTETVEKSEEPEKEKSEESNEKEAKKEQKPAINIPILGSDNNANSNQNSQEKKLSDPRYAPIIVVQGQTGPTNSVGYENNLQVLNDDPINQLEKSEITTKTSFIEDRSNVVAQGKFITAILETAISTETEGSVRGIISRDVFGESGNKVLIPRGSRLYGAYATDNARGQSRVRINWTRLIRPDGVSLTISSFASDQFGRAGIEGIVDNRYKEAITNSLLSSLFAVAGAVVADSALGDNNNINNQQTTTVDPNNGTATITSNATLQAVTDFTRNISDISSRFTGQYFDARPSITVPQGTRITVLVNADIKLPPMKR